MNRPPLVSIIVVNYNSGRIQDVVAKSLSGIASLEYSNLEMIIVDNGSTDGSWKRVFQQADGFPFPVKRIQAGKNLGVAKGNNLGFAQLDPHSKYVCLINNDLFPRPDSLDMLVEALESDSSIGAVFAVQLKWRSDEIENYNIANRGFGIYNQASYGYMADEFLGQRWDCAAKLFASTRYRSLLPIRLGDIS